MVQQRYQITWHVQPGVYYELSMPFEAEQVAMAIRGRSTVDTAARLDLCKEIRVITALTHPEAYWAPVVFENLRIMPLS